MTVLECPKSYCDEHENVRHYLLLHSASRYHCQSHFLAKSMSPMTLRDLFSISQSSGGQGQSWLFIIWRDYCIFLAVSMASLVRSTVMFDKVRRRLVKSELIDEFSRGGSWKIGHPIPTNKNHVDYKSCLDKITTILGEINNLLPAQIISRSNDDLSIMLENDRPYD